MQNFPAMRTMAAAAAILTLSACAGGNYRPVSDSPERIGSPYSIRGTRYVPAAAPTYDALGYASWYGSESGNRTANGEKFRPGWVTAAHTTLPLPTYAEVTALETGRRIIVRINDRGPFVTSRIIDLSRRAAEMLGVDRQGVARVRVKRVYPNERERLALRQGRSGADRPTLGGRQLAELNDRFGQWQRGGRQQARAPARGGPSTATSLAARTPPPVAPMQPTPVPAASPPGIAAPAPSAPVDGSNAAYRLAEAIGGWFVQLGAFGDRGRADMVASASGARIDSSGNLHRVRLGPYFDEALAMAALAEVRGQGYQDAKLVRPVARN